MKCVLSDVASFDGLGLLRISLNIVGLFTFLNGNATYVRVLGSGRCRSTAIK